MLVGRSRKYLYNVYCRPSSTGSIPPQLTLETTRQTTSTRKLIVGLGNVGPTYENTRHNIGRTAITDFLHNHVNTILSKNFQFDADQRIQGEMTSFNITFGHGSISNSVFHDDLVDRYSLRSKQKTAANGVAHPDVQVHLLLPSTYMNRSGTCVRKFMDAYNWKRKRNPESLNAQDGILVVADDVSLPFGTIRFQSRGSAGGQNGVKDIIKCTQSDRIARLKIGIGRPEWFMNGNSGAPARYPMDKYVLSRFSSVEQDKLPHLLHYIREALRVYLHRGLVSATTIINGKTLQAYLSRCASKNEIF